MRYAALFTLLVACAITTHLLLGEPFGPLPSWTYVFVGYPLGLAAAKLIAP